MAMNPLLKRLVEESRLKIVATEEAYGECYAAKADRLLAVRKLEAELRLAKAEVRVARVELRLIVAQAALSAADMDLILAEHDFDVLHCAAESEKAA